MEDHSILTWKVHSTPNGITNEGTRSEIFFIDGDAEFSFQDSDETKKDLMSSPSKTANIKDIMNYFREDSYPNRKSGIELQTNELTSTLPSRTVKVEEELRRSSSILKQAKSKDFIFCPPEESKPILEEESAKEQDSQPRKTKPKEEPLKRTYKTYINPNQVKTHSYAKAFMKANPHVKPEPIPAKQTFSKARMRKMLASKHENSPKKQENTKISKVKDNLESISASSHLLSINSELKQLDYENNKYLSEIEKIQKLNEKLSSELEHTQPLPTYKRTGLSRLKPALNQISKLEEDMKEDEVKVPFHIVNNAEMFTRIRKLIKKI